MDPDVFTLMAQAIKRYMYVPCSVDISLVKGNQNQSREHHCNVCVVVYFPPGAQLPIAMKCPTIHGPWSNENGQNTYLEVIPCQSVLAHLS